MQPDPPIVITLDQSITSIESVHDALSELWRLRPGVGSLDRMALETALIELVTNVIRHALSDDGTGAELHIAADSTELWAQMIDHGHEFSGDLTQLSMPELEAESGRGLAVIDSLMDVFEYRRRSPENRWTISRRLTTPVVTP